MDPNATSCRLSPRIKLCNKKSSEPHVLWPIGFVPALSQARGRPSRPLSPASMNCDKNVRQLDYAGPRRGVIERRGRARPRNHPDKGSHGTGRQIPPGTPYFAGGTGLSSPRLGPGGRVVGWGIDAEGDGSGQPLGADPEGGAARPAGAQTLTGHVSLRGVPSVRGPGPEHPTEGCEPRRSAAALLSARAASPALERHCRLLPPFKGEDVLKIDFCWKWDN